MSEITRVRASEEKGIVNVKILMKHEMESGQRKDSSGKNIPAWFIKTVNVKAQGKDVLNADFGSAISKDPYINFKYRGSNGDKLMVTWVDTKGDKRSDEAVVS
ncbi:thiosulfate oxidation carrier complex protein SoxZ [Polynucleobacter necessarius]|uniref:thiosulfate oxidation carrier complex protein SoxZ n=1 Tax=Polynucleobacter necessarius TaxID=576610 RepID=UPI000E092DBD|nr:thiosulfate oxidation carrier complex protein SoxZ [Polynucleobacter necessarius]